MPVRFYGSVEDRYKRLERTGRRCDANSRRCVNNAVEEYDLIKADGDGNPVPGEKIVQRKSCGRHRAQFLQSAFWVLVNERRIGLAEQAGDDRSIA